MKRRSAFTLVEIVVVICLMAILLVPFGLLAQYGYRHYLSVAHQADAKTECQRASERIFHWLANHPKYRLDADNHGLTGADGSHVFWTGQGLLLQQSSRSQELLSRPVRDFTVTPHKNGVTLNLCVELSYDSRRPTVLLQEIYDYPRVGAW